MFHWFGHASLRFDGSKVIYTDPWELKASEPKADIILITHDHFDHCSPPDVAKISKPTTVIVAPEDAAKKLAPSGVEGFKGLNVQTLKPGKTKIIDGLEVEAVPSYNTNKQFHPKGNNWVGYIFTLDGKRIYQAGDTDLIPEMKSIKADVVIVPIGGTYTMTAAEAAEAVNIINPKAAIPIHWGKIVGDKNDFETFKKLVKCEVIVLEME